MDGSAEEERIFQDTQALPDAALRRRFLPGSWSPDGGVLAFSVLSPTTRGDIWSQSQMGDEPLPFATSEFHEVGPAFSPDGRFIAYVSDESGRNEIYIRPYPGPGEKRLVSTDGGEEPVWSRDGTELFYRSGNKLLAVSVGTELGISALLFDKPFHRTRSHVVGAANYDVSADGESFIMLESDDEDVPTEIIVVLNWFEELKRLVPTDN